MDKKKDTAILIIDTSPIYAKGLQVLLKGAGFKNVTIKIEDFAVGASSPSMVNDEYKLVFYHLFDTNNSLMESFTSSLLEHYSNSKTKTIYYTSNYSEFLIKNVLEKNINGVFLLSDSDDGIVSITNRVLKGELSISKQILKEYILLKRIKAFENYLKEPPFINRSNLPDTNYLKNENYSKKLFKKEA